MRCRPRFPTWGSRLVAALATALVLALGAAATTRATPGGRWLVFAATPPGLHVDQLFRIRSSGTGLAQLTTGAYPSIEPAFSPDGKRLAFARTGVGILVVNLDGTGLRRVTTNPRDSFPSWSPDGKQIAFVRPGGASWRIHVASASGGAPRLLAKAPPSGRPSWTKSGLLIPSGGDLLRIDPSTGHVLKYYGVSIDAVWGMDTTAVSGDASRLTYLGAASPEPGDKECGEGPCQRFALYTEPVRNNAKPRLLVRNVGPASFSPDGKTLAYVAQGRLVLSPLPGGAATPVPTGDAYPTIAAPPVWQPR